jgi:CRISPR system Cascade subunit CasD
MATLLVRLAAPLQSWATASHFDLRATERAPSKSAVVGLVAAAMGRGRDEDVADLADLTLGVRVDRAGSLLVDYHTAGGGYVDARGRPSGVVSANGVDRRSVVTRRVYLQDACFLVGLEGERAILEAINEALRRPRWPLALGRRSCPPMPPVHAPGGPVDLPLEEALRVAPWSMVERGDPPDELELVIEDPHGDETVYDQPVQSFALRRFAPRRLRRITVPMPEAA